MTMTRTYHYKMVLRWIICLTLFQLCAAWFEIRPGTNGTGSVTVFNQSTRATPDIDFKRAEEVLLFNRTSKERTILAQGFDCPSLFFNDLVYRYFTLNLANPVAFRDTELPPFLQVRFAGGPGNSVVRQYITQQFQSLNWQVETDNSIQTTPLGPISFNNIIATYNPGAARRLVLACHYDSKFTPTGYIGAIEAAVPCALLIDLAKRMTPFFRWVTSSQVGIQMIFFDGKEPYVNFSPTDSLYGSRRLAFVWQNTVDPVNTATNKLGTIDYFILLNVLGHSNTQFERFFPETDDIFTQLITWEVCLALKGLLLRPLPLTRQFFQSIRRTVPVYDDHVPFQQRGVKVMHLVSYPFPPEWHTLGDVVNTVDYTIVEDLNRIFRLFLANYFVSGSFG